jgi:hypothetical protein
MSSHGVRCHSRLDTDSVLDSRAVVESWTNPARRGEVLFVCPYEDLGDAGGRDDALEVAPLVIAPMPAQRDGHADRRGDVLDWFSAVVEQRARPPAVTVRTTSLTVRRACVRPP